MKKRAHDITNGQIFSLSRVTADRATDDQARVRFRGYCRICCGYCGQFTVAALAAGLVHRLATRSGDIADMLNVLAAISAFAFIGLAMQSRRGTQALLNVLAAPIIFAAAYAGFLGDAAGLIISFALHAIISALQITLVDRDLQTILFLWTLFSAVMVVLLGIG
jgi:hypothetical protein